MSRNQEKKLVIVEYDKIIQLSSPTFVGFFVYSLPHIAMQFFVFFCLWGDVKNVLRIEPFVEIWDKN